MLVPVFGFGPEVEADPLGVLQALVDEHRAGKGGASLVQENKAGVSKGHEEARVHGRLGLPRGGKETIKDVIVKRKGRPVRGKNRGRAITYQQRQLSPGWGGRHGRGGREKKAAASY